MQQAAGSAHTIRESPGREGCGIYYLFRDGLRHKLHAPPEDWEGTLAILSAEGYAAADVPGPLRIPEALSMGEARYCRLSIEADRISGRLHIPAYRQQAACGMVFVWWQESLLIVDRCDMAASALERMTERPLRPMSSAAAFLVELLLALLSEEPARIQQLEDRTAALEQAVLGDETEQFIDRMSELRKEFNRRGRYYAQLGEMAAMLQENASDRFDAEGLRRLNSLIHRAQALREETQMLREYASQVSSEYQSQVDIAQNRIMKVLTIVTTLFLPLSLIAAWYGMNFQHMPELSWVYGYPAVIGLSVLVVAVCLIFFRKRHYW